MKVTSQGKVWLQAQKGIKPDATELEINKALVMASADGSLSDEKFAEFTTEKEAAAGGALKGVLDEILAGQKKLGERIDQVESGGRVGGGNGIKAGAPILPDIEKALADGQGEGQGQPNVVPAHKQYDATRKALICPEVTREGNGIPHPFAGQQAREGERLVYENSQLERAIAGAFIKFSVTRNDQRHEGIPRQLWMTDHDKQLMQYALQQCEWGGVVRATGEGFGDNNDAIGLGSKSGGQRLTSAMQKAILDDSTSGGLEAAPIFFDDMLIKIPLLHSEFFPKVKLVNITRGRRIEGASIGTVTITASTEGTAISLFNTANFIAAFDTTIFVASGAIEIGLDFLSDSPLDIAGAVAEDYQQVLLNWLDSQIIGGDGTTEPEGILSASGTTTVNATNGAGGAWTVGDVEALLFGVTKAYKGGTDTNRIGFGSLETTYRRIRGIAVSTTDQRRVFGMTHEDYKVLMRFWGIGSSGTGGFTSNRQAIFGNFARYRMYRRLGMTVTSETAGATLRRTNTMLMIARSRWGGNLEDGASFAVCADGQS